jgi:amino acid transporter
VISLLVGWKWNPGVGFGVIATLAVPLVVLVYMLVSIGCIVYYLRQRRSEFNPLLHLILPIGGIVLFFFPLYYQFYKVQPPYPFRYANWVAIAYAAVGIAVTIAVVRFRPGRLEDLDRVYVEDEDVSGITPVA